MPAVAAGLSREERDCAAPDGVLERVGTGAGVDGGATVEEGGFGDVVETEFEVEVDVEAEIELAIVVESKLHVTGSLASSSKISKLGLLTPFPVAEVGVISK